MARRLDDADRQRIMDEAYKTPQMLRVRAYVALNPKSFQWDRRYNMEQMRDLIRDQAEYIKKLEAERESQQ